MAAFTSCIKDDLIRALEDYLISPEYQQDVAVARAAMGSVPDDGPLGSERDQAHDRVDQVIDDLTNNQISRPKVEALGRAVERAKSHGGVFRAIGGIGSR